ncbi:MAG TPA: hypothetical protein VKB71_09505 [Rhizomicrobium sp.]|nr:hypothetical protein [Rhizomicrobium sp.]
MNVQCCTRGRAPTVAAALLCVALAPLQALAWGSTGHRFTGELAVRDLPATLPEFVRNESAALEVGEVAREPDRSRGSGDPHDRDLDPGHFVDVSDDLKILEGPTLSALPATREDYDRALRAIGSDEYKAGYLPYSIMDGWQQVVKDFAYWRADVAGEKFAKTDVARAWFHRDRETREALTLRDIGYWAHFVGDASQPMHASVHYDGWGDFPNPEGFSTTKGIHIHFEGPFVREHVSEADVQALVAPYQPYTGTIQSRVSAYLAATQAEVVPLYRLEKAHAFDSDDAKGKAFAAERLAAAVDQLRNMIADAWVASEDAKLGYPAIAVKDIESGKADALGPLQGLD